MNTRQNPCAEIRALLARNRLLRFLVILHIPAFWALSMIRLFVRPGSPMSTLAKGDHLTDSPPTEKNEDFLGLVEDVEVIGVDYNSALGMDVTEIVHRRQSASIVVNFKSDSDCRHPVLRGRISGPSLAIIEWDANNRAVANNRTIALIGRYDLPTTGLHYVEIIALLCEEWTYDTDFQSICLEDPTRHRLTELNASINVTVLVPRSSSIAPIEPTDKNVLGQWHLKCEYGSTFMPLYTRWQRKTCGVNGTDYCPEIGSVNRFQPYTFRWYDDSIETKIRQAWYNNNSNTTTTTRLCYVGASHAQQLFKSTKKILFQAKAETNLTTVAHFYVQYPKHVTRQFVQNMLEQFSCNRVVIGIGQWPASRSQLRPYLFPEYEATMATMLTNIQNYTWMHGIQFYIRSMNYNPLGGIIASCPPQDWRSPMVVDTYNDILRRLSDRFNITFIDSNFIIGPMWDSAADWCHYRNEVGDQMARHIVGKILNVL